MKQLIQALQTSLVLLTISCLHTSKSATAFIGSSELQRNTIWPKYFDDELLSSYLGDENFMPESDVEFIPETYHSTKNPKTFGILNLLRHGPLSSRDRDADYLSVVNKRTHDEETSFGTFTDGFDELTRRRKSGGGNGFDALLKAARIMDELEGSRSFSPWAG